MIHLQNISQNFGSVVDTVIDKVTKVSRPKAPIFKSAVSTYIFIIYMIVIMMIYLFIDGFK